jgi:alpha-ribazole phosphatase
MNLYFIRHTRVNLPEGICYGNTDIDVAKTFEQDYRDVLEKLKNITFDKVYSSPLKRCTILAEKISKKTIILDDRLKEMNFGDWELKKWDSITDTYARQWMDNFVHLPCPNGESYTDLYNRTVSFINDIQKKSANNIAIVTHGGVIRAAWVDINNRDLSATFTDFNIGFGQVFAYTISKL